MKRITIEGTLQDVLIDDKQNISYRGNQSYLVIPDDHNQEKRKMIERDVIILDDHRQWEIFNLNDSVYLSRECVKDPENILIGLGYKIESFSHQQKVEDLEKLLQVKSPDPAFTEFTIELCKRMIQKEGNQNENT